jgi:death-on-curing protein
VVEYLIAMASGHERIWHPSVEDIAAIHEDVVSEYPETEPGIRSRGDIEFAVEHVRRIGSGQNEAALHEKAFHLLRLLIANHPFVDGNKRTALAATAAFYFFNGYEFDYDHGVRSILKSFATDAGAVDRTEVLQYLRSETTPLDLDEAIREWRDDLVRQGVEKLVRFREESDDRSS